MGHEQNELPLVNSLDRLVPALRRELVFRLQTFAGKQCYVVEDPVSARFFRLGLAEYAFASRLDGRKTIGEVLADARRSRADCEFTPADALAICQWVVRSGLAQDDAEQASRSVLAGVTTLGQHRRGRRISPLSMQLPLFHPDRFFQQLEPWLAWCFSFPALIAWLAVVCWALRDVVAQHHRLFDASSGILAAGNWIWLGIAWVLLKVIHECGHAVACRRFGGEVREAGVIFILLAPLAYVDVTSSWRLRSKWARIAVAAAGMYVEIFLAAVATIVWARVAPGTTSQFCFNMMTTASVMTVLFNANPLMRFDGYYILSDFLELPNLYTSGQQYVSYLVRRLFFGMRSTPPTCQGTRGVFVRCYGVASLIWRNLVFFSLVLTAATLLQGAGIILSVIALVLWLGAMVRRFISFTRHDAGERPNWLHFVVVGGSAAALAMICLVCLPWPGSVTAPAVVQYAPEAVVRTQCDGFAREIRVQGGDRVEAGQVLAVMSNDELDHELAELAVAVKQSELKRRIHQRQGEMAKFQAESEQLRTLQKQHAEKRSELDSLVVRAPCSGKVIGRNLDSLAGRYLTKGSYLLSIGNEAAKEVRLSIAQQDMPSFRLNTGKATRVHLPDSDVLLTTLTKVEPRASVIPIDMSLCAPNGGVLAVRNTSQVPQAVASASYELLSPRFTGIVELDGSQSEQVYAGQRARVALRPYETVGSHLYQIIADWVDKKLHRKAHHRVSNVHHF